MRGESDFAGVPGCQEGNPEESSATRSHKVTGRGSEAYAPKDQPGSTSGIDGSYRSLSGSRQVPRLRRTYRAPRVRSGRRERILRGCKHFVGRSSLPTKRCKRFPPQKPTTSLITPWAATHPPAPHTTFRGARSPSRLHLSLQILLKPPQHATIRTIAPLIYPLVLRYIKKGLR